MSVKRLTLTDRPRGLICTIRYVGPYRPGGKGREDGLLGMVDMVTKMEVITYT